MNSRISVSSSFRGILLEHNLLNLLLVNENLDRSILFASFLVRHIHS